MCVMYQGEKNNVTVWFSSVFFSATSVLLNIVTKKIRSDLVTPPDFFHAFPYLPWEQLFRQRLLCRQNWRGGSILMNYRRVIYLAFLSEVFTLRKGNVGRWFPRISSNTGETNKNRFKTLELFASLYTRDLFSPSKRQVSICCCPFIRIVRTTA